jgi:hypothetical protein
MKVFISWSGGQSKKMAEALRWWLKYVIQSADPFVSSLDIAKGDRGFQILASELEQTEFGIVCVTRDNSQTPWINFEAGALSKAFGHARVIPCLLDMPISDLTGPLAQFQAVSSVSKDDVFSMVRALRDHAELTDLDDQQLKDTFELFWSRLELELDAARKLSGDVTVKAVRDPADVMAEVLVLARRQESMLRTIAERVDSTVPMLDLRKARTTPGEQPESRRLVDELVDYLAILGDTAQAYRHMTDRDPEEMQVLYAADAINTGNVDAVTDTIMGFVTRTSVQVNIKSRGGYEIIVGPGKAPIVLPPAEHSAPADAS